MTVQTLTFEQLVVTAGVILLIIGIYNTVMTAVKNRREEKKRRDAPMNSLEAKVDSLEERADDHDAKLKRDYDRLNAMDSSIRILMRALMALLSHDINGNSTDKLKASFEEMQKYLIDK